MLNTICADHRRLAFAVWSKSGVIERLWRPVLARPIDRQPRDSADRSTVATNIVTADQYIAIMLRGGCSSEVRGAAVLAPVVLSRHRDSGPSHRPGSLEQLRATWRDPRVATLSYAPFHLLN